MERIVELSKRTYAELITALDFTERRWVTELADKRFAHIFYTMPDAEGQSVRLLITYKIEVS